MPCAKAPASDRALIQIVDNALADAVRRSGSWLACRPGCAQCCVGVFAINQLDADRLKRGLDEMEMMDPIRAHGIRTRAQDAIQRRAADFPGDASTGILSETAEDEERFTDFANDEVCPVLDPATGICELYDFRPMTCRTFGPPLRSEEGLGVCELCFNGASDKEISAGEMMVDTDDLEAELVRTVEKDSGRRGRTIVAFAVR